MKLRLPAILAGIYLVVQVFVVQVLQDLYLGLHVQKQTEFGLLR